jgi:hypothetical protein
VWVCFKVFYSILLVFMSVFVQLPWNTCFRFLWGFLVSSFHLWSKYPLPLRKHKEDSSNININTHTLKTNQTVK